MNCATKEKGVVCSASSSAAKCCRRRYESSRAIKKTVFPWLLGPWTSVKRSVGQPPTPETRSTQGRTVETARTSASAE